MMKPDIHRNGKTMLTTMNHNIHCDETATFDREDQLVGPLGGTRLEMVGLAIRLRSPTGLGQLCIRRPQRFSGLEEQLFGFWWNDEHSIGLPLESDPVSEFLRKVEFFPKQSVNPVSQSFVSRKRSSR
jgi:hypothetical protein